MMPIDVFTLRLIENIREDYFDVILVTSRSLGRVKGERRPYRVGKSSFALWLSYLAHRQFYEYKGIKKSKEEIWNEVFERLFYSIYDVEEYVKKLANQGRAVPAIILDEAERSAPAYQSIPPSLRDAIYNINTYGTATKFLILTAPSLKDIAKPLREMVTFEVIIPRRGYFEIQEIVLEKDFYHAPREIGRYIYRGEGTFPPLPPEIDRRYQEWRRKLPTTRIIHPRRREDEDEEDEIEIPEGYLPLSLVARILGRRSPTLRQKCIDGKLDCIKIHGKWYVRIEAPEEESESPPTTTTLVGV